MAFAPSRAQTRCRRGPHNLPEATLFRVIAIGSTFRRKGPLPRRSSMGSRSNLHAEGLINVNKRTARRAGGAGVLARHGWRSRLTAVRDQQVIQLDHAPRL